MLKRPLPPLVLGLVSAAITSGCVDGAADPQAGAAPTSRSTYYSPAGNVCRNELGRFASWDFSVNPLTCKGCNVISAPAGLDGDEFTAASILIGTTADGSLSIVAKAQPGVVFPAGLRPAVLAYHERTAPGVVLQSDVRTYLAGELQDQSGIDFGLEGPDGQPINDLDGQYNGNYVAYGGVNSVQATKPFDAIEMLVRFGPGYTEHLQVYDFCVDIAG